MSYRIKQLDRSDLHVIKHLWEKLNAMHQTDSRFFKDHFAGQTFEKRCEKFAEINDGNILIEAVFPEDSDIPVGYCIASIEKNSGEIDSLFMEEEHRMSGYGKKLVENAIAWLKKNNCKKITVSVADGHESVFGFYRKFGFYPRMTCLELKE